VLAVWRLGILIGWRVGSSRVAWVGVEVWGKDLILLLLWGLVAVL
jgi:hypothetical protein